MPAFVNSVISVGSSAPLGFLVALVPAEPGHVTEVLAEPGEVRRIGEVRGGGEEQRPAVVALCHRVDPGTPGAERGAVRLLLPGLAVDLRRVAPVVGQPRVGEDLGAAAADVEPVDPLGHRRGELHETVGDGVDDVGMVGEHGSRTAQVLRGLIAERGGVRGRRLVDAGVRHAVLRHEPVADLPERRAVHRVRGSVALVVVLAVPAALAGAEPGDRRNVLGVVAARRLEHGPRHRAPLAALGRAAHPPSIGAEPGRRRARHHRGGGEVVDAEVVPVEEEHEVGEAETPRCVSGFVARARGEAALSLDDEDADVTGAGSFQRERLTCRRRHPVARRPGVELQEQRLPRHLRVARQAVAMTQLEQLLVRERPSPTVGKGEGRIGVASGTDPQRLVERGECRVDERDRVPRGQHEAVGERQPGAADVPPHRPGQQCRQEQVHLRPRAARMPALAVVQREVDELVDDVLEHLPRRELRLRLGDQPLHVRRRNRVSRGVADEVGGESRMLADAHEMPPCRRVVRRVWQHLRGDCFRCGAAASRRQSMSTRPSATVRSRPFAFARLRHASARATRSSTVSVPWYATSPAENV